MQVTVKQLNRTNNGKVSVVCSANFGDIIGIWQGEEPDIGKNYYVEIDIPTKLVWGTDIVAVDSHEYRAWNEGDTNFMIAKKEVFDEDGCLTFRLGDHLTMVETVGEPISREGFYKIRLDSLLIYPIAY
jgi:hypothetical protein